MAVGAGGAAPSPGRNEPPELIPRASPAEKHDHLQSLTSVAAKKEPRPRNTFNLGLRLCADAAAALSAGFLVAPVITMIDKAIIENASGRRPLVPSMRSTLSQALLRPHIFITSRPFLLILALYSGTYLTANTLDTTSSVLRNNSASTTTSGPSKFFTTSAANLSLCLYKDSQFARCFGTIVPGALRPVPLPTYALFAARDCLTVFASFNLPPLIAPAITLPAAAAEYVSRASVAQFVAPAAVQLISTPLHLLGLDLYNRHGETPWVDRWRKVRVDWLKSSLARMARIVPAFGVGGVVNTRVRASLMSGLE